MNESSNETLCKVVTNKTIDQNCPVTILIPQSRSSNRKALGKTLIVVPRGDNIWKETYDFINKHFPCQVVAKTSHQSAEEIESAESEFRNNKNVRFMVVVDMCGTGWNYKPLEMIIDLTFTKNLKVLIQRLSRLCRLHKGKEPKHISINDYFKNHKIAASSKFRHDSTVVTLHIKDKQKWVTFLELCRNECQRRYKMGLIPSNKEDTIELEDYLTKLSLKIPLNTTHAVSLVGKKIISLYSVPQKKIAAFAKQAGF